MKRLISFVLAAGLLFVPSVHSAAARTLTDGKGIPVVSNPKDLSLVDLKPFNAYMKADLKNKGDFGTLRRLAVAYKAKRLGIPDTRTQSLHVGAVITRGSGELSSGILVMLGDIQYDKLVAESDRDFQEYQKVNGGNAQTGQREIDGVTFKTFDYIERPYTVYVGNMPQQHCVLFASIPRQDQSVLEETIKVLKGEEKLNEEVPAEVDAQTTFKFTPREIERMVKFNRPSGGLRAKVSGGMKTLAEKLGIPHSDDKTVPLESRIRGQIAQCESMTAKYHWEREAKKASAYTVTYQVRMKNAEAAEQLRELISEQVVRLSEQSTREDEKESLGKLTVQASGEDVSLTFLLDSPEAQYEHVSLLMSQTLRYRNLTSFLDRYGSAN
ncbi:MAG: hypothetical protein HQM09_13300 [Candidatus Riflebacteria bacterium]|nr:hypothetical protein [Candidatus Riflebacteria bacterium]